MSLVKATLTNQSFPADGPKDGFLPNDAKSNTEKVDAVAGNALSNQVIEGGGAWGAVKAIGWGLNAFAGGLAGGAALYSQVGPEPKKEEAKTAPLPPKKGGFLNGVYQAAAAAGLFVVDQVVGAGFGSSLVGIAKYFLSANINIEAQTTESIHRLNQITGNEKLSLLLLNIGDPVLDFLEVHAVTPQGPEQLKLWRGELATTRKLLQWMLPTGVVNLFQRMETHPLEEVNKIALEQKLSQTEKLALYLYRTISPRIAEVEASIQAQVHDGKLDPVKNPNQFNDKLILAFSPIVSDIIEMAFGDKKQWSYAHKVVLKIAKSTILEQMADQFRLGQNSASRGLENLDHQKAMSDLTEHIKDPEAIRFLSNMAENISYRVSGIIEKKLLTDTLKPFTPLTTYMSETKEWKNYLVKATHTVLLKALKKHLDIYSATGIELTAANIAEAGLSIFNIAFDQEMSESVDLANGITDPLEKQKKLRELFIPSSAKLYALIQSEIPIPFACLTKELLEKFILEEALPDALADYHNDFQKHKAVGDSAVARLENCVKNNHALPAAEILTSFISSLIPYKLVDDKHILALMLLEVAEEEVIKIRNMRIDEYISIHKEEVFLMAQAMDATRYASLEEIKELAKDPAEMRRIFIAHTTQVNGESALLPFMPKAEDIRRYLEKNGKDISKIVAKNLEAIGRSPATQIGINIVRPLILSSVRHVLANFYEGAKEIDALKDSAGQRTFLPGLGLRAIKTIGAFAERVNKGRIKYRTRSAYKVPHEKMIEEFGFNIHKGVPRSKEALEAQKKLVGLKKEERQILRSLDRAHQRKAQAKSDSNAGEVTHQSLAIEYLRTKWLAVKEDMRAAEGIIDATRKINMKEVVEGFLKFAKITKAADLPLPEPISDELWEILKESVLPEVGVTLLKKFMEPHTQNKILLSLLEIIEEADKKGEWTRLVYKPPEDKTQQELDKAVGQLALQVLQMAPQAISYAAFQLKGIHAGAAGAIGGMIRQKLSNDYDLTRIFEEAFQKVVVPALVKGEWNEDDKPFFQPLRNGKPTSVSFDLPETIEEKEAQAIAQDKEERELANRLDNEFAKMISNQTERVLKFKGIEVLESLLKKALSFIGEEVKADVAEEGNFYRQETYHALWDQLQTAIDLKIEERLGSFPYKIKKVADKACRFIFFTVIGSILGAVASTAAVILRWVFKKYIILRGHSITNTLQMGILEDLWLRILDDTVEELNNPGPKKIKSRGLTAEAFEKRAKTLEEQKASLEKDIAEDSYIHRIMKRARKLREQMQKKPLAAKIQPITDILDKYTGPVRAGLEKLSLGYDICKIAPDGHCLFRTIGTGILHQLKDGILNKDHLIAQISFYLKNTPDWDSNAERLLQIFEELAADPSPLIEDIMSDKIKSDFIVKILRQVSTAYTAANISETFAQNCEAEQKSVDIYLKDMASMEKTEMGGEEELKSLSIALGLSLQVLHAAATGQNDEKGGVLLYQKEQSSPGIEHMPISLLFTPSHYDLAISKNPSPM